MGIDCPFSQLCATDDIGALVWPAMVAENDRALIASYLARIPAADRQTLLDEMAAGHRHQPVQLPVAYIAGLVRRYLAGDFIATRAHLERAARERATQREGANAASPSSHEASDLPASTRETACKHLAAIRDALRTRTAHRPTRRSSSELASQAATHA
ncbi:MULTISPECIES: hypothetical protein [unclassified Burkholderia]|uniref:hypothetical protein n=1 Tax=unclassified Burkholderia TaxID=2613784 RepID=UPI001624E470|nr:MULTISPECIES: hypothetical protein [unclassified Burkholderia]